MKGVVIFSILTLTLFANVAFAQITLAPKCNPALPPNLNQLEENLRNKLISEAQKEGQPTNPCDIPAFIIWIRKIVQTLLIIAIPIGVAFIAYGAFVIMTAGGSDEKVKKGKDIITAAVIGVTVAFGAWLLITTVNNILRGKGF